MRDDILPFLGVKLQDRGKESSGWSLENKDELVKER
jgi:hypothetical protein